MADTPFTRTIGDWEAEFQRARVRRPLPPSAELIEQYRQRFGEISASIRRHRQESRLEHPEFAALQAISHESLLLTRLAHQELTSFNQSGSPAVTPELLDRLLTETQSRLQTIDSQLQLIDSTLSLAESLRPIVEGILSEDGFPARRLESLLQRLDLKTWKGQADRLVPWPGVSWERILTRAGWPQSWFYAQAVHSARWMAAVRGGLADNDSYPCTWQIAAALLADIGLLVIAHNMHGMPSRKDPRGVVAYRKHPDISAAVISGISGASPEWAALARLHHERLDGSGFPSKLSDKQLSPAVRGFTAALRWSELLLQTSTAESVAETLTISAQALWRETQRGAFDPRSVTRMISTVQPSWAASLQQGDDSSSMPLLDPAHALAGPHHAMGVDAAEDSHHHVSVGPPSPQYLRHQRRHAHHRTSLHDSLIQTRTNLPAASGT